MNNKQFFELIKSLYSALKCPGCGEVYDIEQIQFIGHMDGLFLLQMTCHNCQLPISVNFYVQNEKELLLDLNIKEHQQILKRRIKPIDTNDVISFYAGLEDFNGDLRKLLKRKC